MNDKFCFFLEKGGQREDDTAVQADTRRQRFVGLVAGEGGGDADKVVERQAEEPGLQVHREF